MHFVGIASEHGLWSDELEHISEIRRAATMMVLLAGMLQDVLKEVAPDETVDCCGVGSKSSGEGLVSSEPMPLPMSAVSSSVSSSSTLTTLTMKI